jgi:hypothetical protein
MKAAAEVVQVRAERLVADLKLRFEGEPPAVLGVALAGLVAEFFAGMRPDRRAETLEAFRLTVDDMIPQAEKLIFPNGLPAEWRH